MENFFRVWSPKSPVLGVEGLQEDAPRRAMEKWASVYRDDYSERQVVSDQRWNILIAAGSDEAVKDVLAKSDERMPGKIFLLLAEDSE